MRIFILVLVTILPYGFLTAEEDPRVTRVLEAFDKAASEAEEDYQKVVDKAADKRAKELQSAQKQAVSGLKRLLNSRTDAATSASIYRLILTLNEQDTDARKFFETLGSLDQVLADITPKLETDMLGNPTKTKKTSNWLFGEKIFAQFPGNTQLYWIIINKEGTGSITRDGASWQCTWVIEDGLLKVSTEHGYAYHLSEPDLAKARKEKATGTHIRVDGKSENMTIWMEAPQEQ